MLAPLSTVRLDDGAENNIKFNLNDISVSYEASDKNNKTYNNIIYLFTAML